MSLNVPEKIFTTKINNIEVGMSEIHIYEKDEIEEAQAGYRYNRLTQHAIEEWPGTEYVVIGNDSCCGDPIIAKIDEELLPIYACFQDDWTTLQKIAESFEQFIDLLEQINKTNLADKNSCKILLENIKGKVQYSAYEFYWEGLIKSAYEFLTDKEF